jgi:hypothetical protein
MSEQTPNPASPPGPSIAQRLVAEVVGLPEALASRIAQTDDVAAMKADAQALKALAQPASNPADGLDGGTPRERPHANREYIKKLAKTNPAEFNRLVESGSIDLGRLR